MRFSKKRVAVTVAIFAVVACGAWLAGTPSGCVYSVPADARELLGCWKITSSTDERYPAGESLCLHPDRVVVRASDGTVSDGWRVTWSRNGAAWRMTVPPDLIEGFDIHFVIAAGDAGGYSFRSGAGWVGVTLDHRSPLLDDDVLARLRACHVCVARLLEKDSAASQMWGSPPYSLRACVVLARTQGDRSCDFQAIEGR